MRDISKMLEEEAKFYFCELAYVLQYLHNDMSIVYRDLKPENVLLDHNGHVKLCDFGFAVQCSHRRTDSRHKLKDTCGTANYIAPEVISGQDGTYHNFPVDWWALGCVLFEMICGHPPFGDTATMKKFSVFENVVKKPLALPSTFSPELRRLMEGLLNKDQRSRSAWNEVSFCGWLVGVNWEEVRERRLRPPWIPKCSSRSPDTRNFVPWPDLVVPYCTPSKKAEDYCKPLGKKKLLLRSNFASENDDVEEVDSDDNDYEDDNERDDSASVSTSEDDAAPILAKSSKPSKPVKAGALVDSKLPSQRGGLTDTSPRRGRNDNCPEPAVRRGKSDRFDRTACSQSENISRRRSPPMEKTSLPDVNREAMAPSVNTGSTGSRKWRHNDDSEHASTQQSKAAKPVTNSKWRHTECI